MLNENLHDHLMDEICRSPYRFTGGSFEVVTVQRHHVDEQFGNEASITFILDVDDEAYFDDSTVKPSVPGQRPYSDGERVQYFAIVNLTIKEYTRLTS